MKKRTLCAALVLLMIPFLLTGVVAAQDATISSQTKESLLDTMTTEEAFKLFNWVLGHLKVDTREFGPKTSQRIDWMFRESQNINFTLAKRVAEDTEEKTHLMIAGYDNGKLELKVNLGWLVKKYWENYRSNTPISRQDRNDLAILLSHEVIHLQHGPLLLQALKTDPALLGFEERRTWAQSVIEDIRPLVERNEAVNTDYTVAQILLRYCDDDMDCQAFKNFAAWRTAPSK